ncbi:unnamed protein product, partial [marine sediment metagenome]
GSGQELGKLYEREILAYRTSQVGIFVPQNGSHRGTCKGRWSDFEET